MAQIFDEWEHVDCNDCTHYWNDSCDGASNGENKPCNSFLATKRIDLHLQVKSIREQIQWLVRFVVFLFVCVIGLMCLYIWF